MKKIGCLAVCGAVLGMSGCSSLTERLFAHYVLSEQDTSRIAMLNAGVNVCLANEAVDKNKAYAFSNASAKLMDISVIDRDFYAKTYKEYLQGLEGKPGAKEGCATLDRDVLEKAARYYTEWYIRVASSLAVSRSQELEQMTQILNNFGNNAATLRNSYGYSPTYPQYGWPNVSYSSETNETSTYLVNSSRGHVQCRVTSKNYVFCM